MGADLNRSVVAAYRDTRKIAVLYFHNLADTEYLAREVVALRLAIKDMATKDFIRAELRSLLEELDADREGPRER